MELEACGTNAKRQEMYRRLLVAPVFLKTVEVVEMGSTNRSDLRLNTIEAVYTAADNINKGSI